MSRKALILVLLAALGVYAWNAGKHAKPPTPPTPPAPAPAPKPRPKPKPRPGPWGPQPCPHEGQEVSGSDTEAKPQDGSGKTSPDGTEEVTCDLPEAEKKHNVGGRDGAGLCVFTSIEYAGRWAHERELFDFQKNMRQEPGGGYPEKVDRMMKKYAPGVRYVQHTGGDPEVLRAILASGRIACVTYDGHDCHYSGSIAHMVCLVHYTDKWAVVSDNNFTKDDQLVWMSPDEFCKRWKGGGGGGWVVCLLAPPPPPPPHN